MNWKAFLPAAALLALIMPTAALSRNHHYYNDGSNQNGMTSQFGNNGGQFNGASSQGMMPYANAGGNPYTATPFANGGQYGANAFANNGMNFASNNGMMGMNNGGMCQRRRHKHKRRGLLNALMNQNSMMGNGYNNYGNNGFGNSYGNRGMFGNSYGGGLTGGLRNMLGRI